MHRFSSQSSITRLKFAAILHCFGYLLVPLVIGIFGYSIYTQKDRLTFLALGLGGCTVFIIVIHWILAARARCPLCMTPVLAGKKCSKHRDARPLLGSYRLKVALCIVVQNKFRCPYCNEPSVMEVRKKLH